VVVRNQCQGGMLAHPTPARHNVFPLDTEPQWFGTMPPTMIAFGKEEYRSASDKDADE